MYASEAREDFERQSYVGNLNFPELVVPFIYGPDHWFFLLQSQLAVSHLTDCQHCDVETISYAGIINGKHVWMGRT